MYVTIMCNVFYRKSYRCYNVWRNVYTTHHRINIIEYNMIYYQYLCTLYSVHKCVTCYYTLYLVASANSNHTILYSVYTVRHECVYFNTVYFNIYPYYILSCITDYTKLPITHNHFDIFIRTLF